MYIRGGDRLEDNRDRLDRNGFDLENSRERPGETASTLRTP